MTSKFASDAEGMVRVGRALGAQPGRALLLARLAELPDEAWAWVVVSADRSIWPESLDGFQRNSKAAIEAARSTAHAMLNPHEEPVF
jgi:hypothetical protein